MNQRRFVNSMKKTIKVLAWIVSGVLFASSVMACGRQPEQPATEPVDKTTSKAPVTETPTTEEPETEEPNRRTHNGRTLDGRTRGSSGSGRIDGISL